MNADMPGKQKFRRAAALFATAMVLFHITAGCAGAYDLGTTVADMRQPAWLSGGTACPQLTRFDISTPGEINRQWSTSLGGSPTTILTESQDPQGRLDEIEGVIDASLATWTGVAGTTLVPASLGQLQRTWVEAACASNDGVNTLCFNQDDPGFTLGVLAFTRVVTADTIGEQLSASTPPSTFIGEILDADVLLRPGDPGTTFATPAALASNPGAYDLQSIVTHEIGHSFGFNHSGVWSAMMFPYAPPPGQFTGVRPTATSPDAPLSDDDRAGLRILYPDPGDSVHIGTISGRVLPASDLALPISPPNVTGIFPAQVVALDRATGAVGAAVLAGWSCTDPGPVQFDGRFLLQALPMGASQSYEIYAEPMDGLVVLGNVIYNATSLCRNSISDPEWPEQYACTVPEPAAPFSARIK